MADTEFQFDLREFTRCIEWIVAQTGKDEVELVNRAALVSVIGGRGVKGAMQRTPKADPTRIRAKLNGVMAERIVEKNARQKGVHLTRKEIKTAARKLVSSRASAAGYTRGPGWNKAAQAFGGKGVRTQGRFSRSLARQGYGLQARKGNLVAEIANYAPAADIIGRAALQAALDDAAQDMVRYWAAKTQRTFDKSR